MKIIKIYVSVVVLLLVTAGLNAQSFSDPQYFVDTLRFNGVDERQWVDLDGDQDLDLVIASRHTVYSHSSRLYWVENDGLSFDRQRLIEIEGVGTIHLAAADMDGNGTNDIVYTTDDDNRLAWIPNDGEGSFAPEITIKYPEPDTETDNTINSTGKFDRIEFLQVADVDRDGDQDIVFGDRGRMGWYLNEGDGIFGALRTLEADVYPYNVSLIQLRGDSSLDFVTSGEVYEYQDSTGFLSGVSIPHGFNASSNEYVDFDGDGLVDIITKLREGIDYKHVVYLNRGDSTFADSTRLHFGEFTHGSPIKYSDIDGDGDIDRFEFNSVYQEWMWYENMGDYQFERHRLPQPGSETSRGKEEGAVNTDLVFTSNPHKIGYFGYEQDSVLIPKTLISNPSYWNPSDYVTSDFNGDGIEDVVISFNCPNDLTLHLSQSDGSFLKQELISYRDKKVQTCDSEVKAGDVDNDGDLDLLLLADHAYKWFINKGNGVFSQTFTFHKPETRERGWVADVNEDGYEDVVTLTGLKNEIAWYENNKDQSFQRHSIEEFSKYAIWDGLVLADLNGDGERDLIYINERTSESKEKIIYREHTGTGEFFSTKSILLESVNLSNLYAADVDSDSDMDLIYAISTGIDPIDRRTMWLENKGDGSFASKGKRLIDNHRPLVMGDLDLDGDQDIVTHKENWVSYNNSIVKLVWMQNDGSQQYSSPIQVGGWNGAVGKFQMAQLSDDQKADILVLEDPYYGNKIGWLQNNIPRKHTAIGKDEHRPRSFSLGENFPNPFNPTTTIQYSLPEAAEVNISIYNALGQRVAKLVNQRENAGEYTVSFDGKRLSSGVYIYRITAGDYTESKKMLLLK